MRKHRYAAYSIANDLNLVADFSASKADFDKQVRAVKGVALPTQLYKGAHRGDRQAGEGEGRPQSPGHPGRRQLRRHQLRS